ncbi:MAG: 6-bladed beta-propeller [Bacteroides sp.]|nr:6-bladed beta-propeller [Bacteroides sp.]
MNKYSLIYLTLILIAAIGCTSNNKAKSFKSLQGNKRCLNIFLEEDISKDKRVSLDSLIDTMYYISPQLTNESVIGRYDKVLVNDSLLFIMENSISNKSVFVFDLKGKFLSKVNSFGQGPGEYISIHDFYYDNRNKLIGVLSQSCIIRYNLDGTYKDQFDLRNYYVSEVEFVNGHLYAYCLPQCNSSTCFSVLVFNENFDLIYEDYPLSKEIINFPLSDGKRSIISYNNKVYFNAINNDTIYLVKDSFMRPECIVNLGKYKYPKEDFDNLLNEGAGSVNRLNELYASNYSLFGVKQYWLSEEYVYLNFQINTEKFQSFYSIKSNRTITFSSSDIPSAVLPINNIQTFYKGEFYSVSDNQLIEYIKNKEEESGVLKLPDDNLRKVRYNRILRNSDINNNSIIAVFRLKKF